ncbi:MAG TPA: FixH family protein [Anaerolineales bacterium]|jgi:hypothetical protein|nr:FixH family protein [Anaerolineales bacterium]
MKKAYVKSQFTRLLSRVGGLMLLSAFITGIMPACMGNAPTPEIAARLVPSPEKPTVHAPTAAARLDFSKSRLSDNGLFLVSYASSQDLVPVNKIHQWTLHVETADGNLVENAAITVDGDMPEHGHGLPTRPQVTKYLGNGDYLVEGMKFQMGGWWVIDFTITTNSHTDAVHFNMQLN